MYKRSDIRYACTRAKNKNAAADHQPILNEVSKLLKSHQRWENFKTTWDLLVDKDNNIVIIDPETDRDFVHSTCLEYSFSIKNNIPASFTDRQNNIISIVDAMMLDGKMSWNNYNKTWGVEIDYETKMIKTKMYNIPSNQITVTPEMIKASMKEPEGIIEQDVVVLDVPELKPMSDTQIAEMKNSIPRNELEIKKD